jgi:peptidyl-tRNA hydrolase
MPIVKHRDNFSEILSRAASKKVVNQVRSTDTLYQIQEDASSKSRRLSTKLVGSLRLRPLKSSGSIGELRYV